MQNIVVTPPHTEPLSLLGGALGKKELGQAADQAAVIATQLCL